MGAPRVPFGDRRLAPPAVAGAIGRYLRDVPLDLIEQAGQDFAVTPGGGGHFDADEILAGLVNRQMDLAPGATLPDPVLAYFPFPFAEDLQTVESTTTCVAPMRGRREI